MFTNSEYKLTPDKAIEGQPLGDRKSRPAQLAQLPQISRVTITAGAATDDYVLTVVDDLTGQSYSATADGDAEEDTLAANIIAAVRVSEINKIFSIASIQAVDGSDIILDLTARHGNRDYTVSGSGGVGATVVTESQAAGGSGLEFGRMVAKGATDNTFVALGATTTARQLLGFLFRTEANHFHSLENDTPDAVDRCEVGWTYSIMHEGRAWVKVEEDVTPADRVFVRRALTSSAGRLGGFRASPAGSAQVNTFAPTVDLSLYGFSLSLRDEDGHVRDFSVVYQPTDGTTSVADAIDGLYDALVDVLGGATAATNGLGVTITESATLLTITTDAGVEVVDLSSSVWDGDTEAVTGAAVVGTADVDTIDISAFAEYESSASQDGLALLRIRM